MSRAAMILLAGILTGVILMCGCSSIQREPFSSPGQPDPIIGTWVSIQPDSVTWYRFRENGTFEARSHTGDVHPKYSFQYSGEWAARGAHTYATAGPHIGYGDITALAIWRDLTMVYDPDSDTFSITVYPDQVFTRLSHDPDFAVDTDDPVIGTWVHDPGSADSPLFLYIFKDYGRFDAVALPREAASPLTYEEWITGTWTAEGTEEYGLEGQVIRNDFMTGSHTALPFNETLVYDSNDDILFNRAKPAGVYHRYSHEPVIPPGRDISIPWD